MTREKKSKYVVTLKAIVKGATMEFKEGMGPGVIFIQDVEYNLTERQFNDVGFQVELMSQQDRFRTECLEIQTVVNKA